MWQRQSAGAKAQRETETWPEPDNYDKNSEAETMGERVRVGELGTGQEGLLTGNVCETDRGEDLCTKTASSTG